MGWIRNQRGQSETLGFVLIIGIILVGALLIAVIGSMALSETEETLTGDRAESALTQFDAKAGLVALAEADTQRVSFGSGVNEGNLGVEEDNGWMRIEVTDRSDGNTFEVMNLSLGAVTWDGDGERLGYQGGGVWRADSEGGQMISPPEFHFRGATLTLPTVTVTGDGVLSDEVSVSHSQTTQKFPVDTWENPLEDHVVTVTVGSEFYEGWANYFEQRTEGDVETYPEFSVTEMTLVSPLEDVSFTGALSAPSAGGTLTLQAATHHPCGGGNDAPRIDGYDGSEGSYCDHHYPDNTLPADDLTYGGDINFHAAPGMGEADIISGGSISMFHQQEIYGDILYTDDCTVQGGGFTTCEDVQRPPGEVVEQIDGVESDPPIGYIVEQMVSAAQASGNHVELGEGTGQTDTLETGQYYTEEIVLSGETVTFDTSDGDIILAVENRILLENDASIEVLGDGEVTLAVNGSDAHRELFLDGGGERTVWAPETDESGEPTAEATNDATRLTILGDRDFRGAIVGSEFTGAIYAPSDENGVGEVIVDNQGTVYGAVVTGDLYLGQPGGEFGGVGATVHFDRQLLDQTIIDPDESVIRITYLHVTENEISVTN